MLFAASSGDEKMFKMMLDRDARIADRTVVEVVASWKDFHTVDGEGPLEIATLAGNWAVVNFINDQVNGCVETRSGNSNMAVGVESAYQKDYESDQLQIIRTVEVTMQWSESELK